MNDDDIWDLTPGDFAREFINAAGMSLDELADEAIVTRLVALANNLAGENPMRIFWALYEAGVLSVRLADSLGHRLGVDGRSLLNQELARMAAEDAVKSARDAIARGGP